MSIAWQRGEKSGTGVAEAVIHHGAAGIRMEVHAEDSESHSLIADFRREASGKVALLYMYEVEPKATSHPTRPPYKGAAVLQFDGGSHELRGNYWTDQLSTGHFILKRPSCTSSSYSAAQTQVDVLLIAALEEELKAAFSVFSATAAGEDGVREWREVNEVEPPYSVGTFYSAGRALFELAVARPTRMGSNRTGPAATLLCERLHPLTLVMCGVCAGNPEKVALGDVIASELVYQYDEG